MKISRAERARWRRPSDILDVLDAADALRGALVSIRRQYPEHVQLHAFIDSEIAAYDEIVEPPRA